MLLVQTVDKIDRQDDQLLTHFNAGPFNALWKPVIGSHTLRVTASDKAGNSSSQSVQFQVVK